MFSKTLLARSRLSTALATRICSRSLSTSRFARPARSMVALSSANLRWLSTTPAIRTESQDNTRVPPPPTGTCYVANIPYKVTAEQLQDAFSEFAKVVSVKLLTSASGMSRGVGFVKFESPEEAVTFLDTHVGDPIFVLDRQLFVEHAQKTIDMVTPAGPCDTLLVLKFRGESSASVREMFGKHADNILEVRFDKKEAGRPARKAFVQFRDVEKATEAMEAFKNQSEGARIVYAKQRQPPAGAYTLASRLSQH